MVQAQIQAEIAKLDREIEAGEAGSYVLARVDFREFLKYVKVYERPPGRGTIPFEFWPHLEEMIEALPKEPRILWMKARRNGASYLVASYIVFKAQKAGSYFPLASLGEDEAIELLSKVRFVWDHLPEELKWGPLTTDSRTELKWGVEGSQIHAMPSTGKASRGSAVTVGVIDEAEYHEYLNAFYYSVKPSLDDSGGQLIIITTIDPDKKTTLFRELWRGAPGNGFKRYFHGWRARLERDQAWYEARRREYPDQARFEKEFPGSVEEALSPPKTLMAFNPEVLERMKENIKPPLERLGKGRIWQKWYPGKRYIVFTDTSHGVGKDDAVTVILDTATGYVSADIQSSLLTPSELAVESVRLLKEYQSPVWAIEDNDWGRVTIEKAKALGYPRLYYRAEGKCGWHTNEGNRHNLWQDLVEAVNQGLIIVPSEEGMSQFHDIIKNPDKEGRIEAIEGGKDDYPMAVAGAWYLRHRASRSFEGSSINSIPGIMGNRAGLRW